MADGVYPRVNGEQINDGQYGGMMVSVVGRMQETDGQSWCTIEACDGKTVKCMANPDDLGFQQGQVAEIMGAIAEDGQGFDAFVARPLGDDFDLPLYNDLITKVASPDSKFSQYFVPDTN
eukprot:440819_1